MKQILPPLFFSVLLPTRLAMFWRAHVSRSTVIGITRTQPPSFLIFRLDSLGDVVMTTPLFRALKAAHPRSRCTVVVHRGYKSLLATNPHVDEILTLPNIRPAWLPQGMRRLLAASLFCWTQLRKRHFDYAISPRWDVDEHLATLLCVLANASTRVGYSEMTTAAKRKSNRGFDHAYDICLPPGAVRHEVLRNLAVAEALGATACDSRLEIPVTAQDRKRAARLLAKVPANAKLVALGIGAQSRGRRWPLERYAEVIGLLEQEHNLRAVIVCSASEFGEALKLARRLRRAPMIVSGARLRDVCAVLERCELFIGNDSGCAHLAAAMDCMTIVVSRHPRSGDANHFNSPARFAPLGCEIRVFQPAEAMDGCTDGCLSPRPHCILQVPAEEVAAGANRMLAGKRTLVAWTSSHETRCDERSRALLRAHSLEALQAAIAAVGASGPRPNA